MARARRNARGGKGKGLGKKKKAAKSRLPKPMSPANNLEGLDFFIFTKHSEQPHVYKLTRTNVGWRIFHESRGGDCDKKGRPFLYRLFQHDLISYPVDFEDYLEILWDSVQEENLDDDTMQRNLIYLSDWLMKVEDSAPKNFYEVCKTPLGRRSSGGRKGRTKKKGRKRVRRRK